MSGILAQSAYGKKGNFEVLIRRNGGGADHFSRNNDPGAGYPWTGADVAFGSRDNVGAIALVWQRNAELVAVRREGAGIKCIERKTYQYKGEQLYRWGESVDLPGADGVGLGVGMAQSHYGTAGNLEVIAPQTGGGLAHWYRDNDDPNRSWHGPTVIAANQSFRGAAIISSNYGPTGNLEVIAWVDGVGLRHLWRDDNQVWRQDVLLPDSAAVSAPPAFVQSTNGKKGNFEVVAPVGNGGFVHWWRDNDDDNQPWRRTDRIGVWPIYEIGLVQSNLGKGNLEVVANYFPFGVAHAWRADNDGWGWSPLQVFWNRDEGSPALGRSEVHAQPDGPSGIHSVLLRTGKVLLFGFGDPDEEHGAGAMTYEPNGYKADQLPAMMHHLFCSGHAATPDGHVLVVGGHGEHTMNGQKFDAAKGVHLFDPDTGMFDMLNEMPVGRWYPTVTCLADGRLLVISGSTGGPTAPFGGAGVNATTQIFDPTTRTLSAQVPTPSPFDGTHEVDLYPFVYQLPDGRVLVHSRSTTRFWHPATGWSATQLHAVRPQSRTYPGQGTSVLLPLRASEGYRARVLVMGGGGLDREEFLDDATADEPATATVEMLDLGAAAPQWQSRAPMHHGRVLCDAVLQPDGKVLVLGGSARGKSDNGTWPVLPAELYDPITDTWTELSRIHTPRMYHSTAVLLPSGDVLTAGKDGQFQRDPYKYFEHRLEEFSPPTNTLGLGGFKITAAPANATYGSVASVGFTGPVPTQVTLLRTGAVTHGFNMDQRLIEASFRVVGSAVEVDMPPNANIAPPGHYLVFLVSGGVSTSGEMLRLG